jgi:hypothetical protein
MGKVRLALALATMVIPFSLSLSLNNQQPPFLNLTPAIYYDGVSDMHYLLRYMY